MGPSRHHEVSTIDSGAGRALAITAGLLAIGLVINIGFELVLPSTASGIRGHEDNSLSTLVNVEQPTLRVRYGFEAYLHDVARGGTITVPTKRSVYGLLIENLSQMSVVVSEYDTEITRDRALALEPVIQIEGKGSVGADHEVVRYWILVGDGLPAPALTYYRVGDDVYVIDNRLGTP